MSTIHDTFCDPDSGEIDDEAFHGYVDELMEEFGDSPEGQGVVDRFGTIRWAPMMMDFAVKHIGGTLPELSPVDIREIVFELFPRKVSAEAAQAGAIIGELRAFWGFLERVHRLKNAALIIALLGDAAVPRLQQLMSDPRNFGMAKSFFMKGQQLGFDMSTEEGAMQFMMLWNANLASQRPAAPLIAPIQDDDWDNLSMVDQPDDDDGPPPATPFERAQQRKKKRRAERNARKRQRRS